MSRRKIRRGLTALAILTFSLFLALVLLGDSLLSERKVNDGESTVSGDTYESAARFAWKDLGVLPLINRNDYEVTASGPAISPQNRDIWFAQRSDDGQGWDLWRSRYGRSGYEPASPLFEVNSERDDRDPAFMNAGSTLVFSSNRPGGFGGYDLWAADMTPAGLGTARNLGPTVNGPNDERSPTLDASSRTMVFASNRLSLDGVSLDLFESTFMQGEFSAPELIAGLRPEDEENSETASASLSPNGRFLVFASDRSGGVGGYDLWRSSKHAGQWQPPELLTALCTEADEWDPSYSPEGTEIYFARQDLREAADGLRRELAMAELRELVPIDSRNAWWDKLLLILGALLAALLLTHLIMAWQGLHPFVKFVLLSILVHLIILLYLHSRPREELELGGDGVQAMAVTFLASAESDSSSGNKSAAQGDRVSAAKASAQLSEVGQAPANQAAVAPESAAPAAMAASEMARAEASSTAEEETDQAADPSRATQSEAQNVSLAAAEAMESSARRTGQAIETPMPAGAQSAQPLAAQAQGSQAPQSSPRIERSSSESGEATLNDTMAAAKANADTARQDSKQGRALAESAPSAAEASKGRSSGAAPSARLSTPNGSEGSPATTNAKESGSRKAGKALAAASPISKSRATNMGRRGGSPQSQRGEIPASASGNAAQAPATEAMAPGSLLSARGRGRELADSGSTADNPGRSPSRSTRPGRGQLSSAGRASEASSRKAETAAKGDGESTEGIKEASLSSGRKAGALSAKSGIGRRRDSDASDESLVPVKLSGNGLGSSGIARRPSRLVADSRGEGPSDADQITKRLSRRSGPRRRSLRGAAKAVARASGAGENLAPMGPTLVAPTAGEGLKAQSFAGLGRNRASGGRLLKTTRKVTRAGGALSEPNLQSDFLARRTTNLGQDRPSVARAAPKPAVHAQRRGAARLAALKKGGGTEETEAAVLAGLRYLAKIQRNDGGWGPRSRHEKYGDFRVGKTGLALLAFLGSGYTHLEESPFQDTVKSGLKYLQELQSRRSGHFGACSSYGHGIATYAMAEAYTMTKDRALRMPLRRAVRRILAAQIRSGDPRVDGGWSYYFDNESKSIDQWPRMSVSVWQIMALKSARLGSIKIPEDVFTRAQRYVLAAHDPNMRAFRYNHDPEWMRNAYPTLPGTTPAALFALQLMGMKAKDGDRRILTGLKYIEKRPPTPRWRRYSDRDFATKGLSNLYYMYYSTLAMFFEGGEAWEEWNQRLTRLLVAGQSQDGSWKPISYYANYCGDTNRDRTYTTAMSVLMLEVYYRYFTPLLTSVDAPK